MKRLVIVIGVAAALAVSSAWAGWNTSPLTIPDGGRPVDVEIVDGGTNFGHFTLATQNAPGQQSAFEVVDSSNAGPPRSLIPPTGEYFVSAFRDPISGLLCAISSKGNLNCLGQSQIALLSNPNAEIQQARHTSSGGTYLRGKDFSTGTPILMYSPNGNGSSPVFLSDANEAVALSALRANGVDYGLYGLNGTKAFFAENGVKSSAGTFDVAGLTAISEVELFQGPRGLEALIGGDGGMVMATLDGGTVTVDPVVSATDRKITGIAFNANVNDAGSGFGMALSVDKDGGVLVYGAVPDPKAPGRTWVAYPSGSQPQDVVAQYTPPRWVRCVGGQFCVLYSGDAAPGNVFLYYNENAPYFVLPASPSVTITEGGAPGTINVATGDLDGDPLYVSWAADGGSPLVLNFKDPTLSVSAPAGTLCGSPLSSKYTVFGAVTDGFHTVPGASTINVTANHVVPPATPVLSASATTVPAGSVIPVTVQAQPGAGVCPPTGYTWKLLSNLGGFTVPSLPDGGPATFQVTPPQNWCNPDAGEVIYEARATDGFLDSDAGTPVTVRVQRWGPPSSPFTSGSLGQSAGTTESYESQEQHPCKFVASDFPGVDTHWSFSSDVDAGFQVNGVNVTSGVVSPRIDVVAPECVSGTVTLTATPYTRGDDAGIPGPTATWTVKIQTEFVPLGQAGLSLDGGYDAAAGEVRGTVASTANCPDLRNLIAALTLVEPGGKTAKDAVALVRDDGGSSAPWRFDLPADACSGGTYKVTGHLEEDGGVQSAAAEWSVTLQPVPVGISDVQVVQLPVAHCEEDGVVRAVTQLRALSASGQCAIADFSWKQLAGAQITGTTTGRDVTLTAAAPTYDALVTQPLRFQVTAQAGAGNSASQDTTVPVQLAERFIQVRHRTDAPVASESGIVGVAVTLANGAVRRARGRLPRGARRAAVCGGLGAAGRPAGGRHRGRRRIGLLRAGAARPGRADADVLGAPEAAGARIAEGRGLPRRAAALRRPAGPAPARDVRLRVLGRRRGLLAAGAVARGRVAPAAGAAGVDRLTARRRPQRPNVMRAERLSSRRSVSRPSSSKPTSVPSASFSGRSESDSRSSTVLLPSE